MEFRFIDEIIEQSGDRIVALKRLREDEDYLRDHFPTFPVMPGVLMLETMTQAARALLDARDPQGPRRVLGEVRALRYGAFVSPGDALRVEIDLLCDEDGLAKFKGASFVVRPSGDESPAASGRFTLRPVNIAASKA